MTTPAVVDLQPQEVALLGIVGDPFSFHVRLLDDNDDPVDVSLWDWRATVTTGSERLDFDARPEGDGLVLGMRGDTTIRIPSNREFPFDLTGRPPSAGEGVMVLRGQMTMGPRVTEPLRSDPDAAPQDEDLVPR
jgi:hypothetical protein